MPVKLEFLRRLVRRPFQRQMDLASPFCRCWRGGSSGRLLLSTRKRLLKRVKFAAQDGNFVRQLLGLGLLRCDCLLEGLKLAGNLLLELSNDVLLRSLQILDRLSGFV